MADRPTEKISVLHVEDETHFADLTATALEKQDNQITVQTASGPDEGLEMLTDHEFDCIVSDYEMPSQNGIEFLGAVRERYPDVPFILYTGKGSEEIASEAISAGVTDYLQKSGGADQYSILANRIRNAVERFRAKRTAEHTEQQLHRVYGRITDGFTIINPDWEITYINEEGARQLKREGTEIIGRRVWEAFPDILGTSFEEGLRTAMDTQETVRTEEYYAPNDSWYEATVYPAERGISVYFRDITERIEREQNLKQLRERTREFRYTETIEETASRAVDAADDIIDAPLSGVLLTDESETVLEPVAVAKAVPESFPDLPSFERDSPPKSRAALVWEVYRNKNGDRIDSLSASDRVSEESPAESVVVHPLGDHGVFIVSSPEANAFTDTDRLLIEILANNLEESLDRVTREQLLRTREGRLERLHEATRDLIKADSQQAIAERTVEAAEDILGFSITTVRRYDPDEGGLVPVAVTDEVSSLVSEVPVFRPADGTLTWEAYQTATVKTYDDTESFGYPGDEDMGLRSLMVLPLGEYGTLGAGDTTAGAFDETDEFLIRILATTARTVLHSQAQQTELERTNAVLSTLFDALPQGIIAEDESREVLAVNDHLFDLFEESPSPGDAIGRDCAQLAENVKEMFARPEQFIEQIDGCIADRTAIDDRELELADGRVYGQSYRQIRLPEGEGHLWIYQDMTDRLQYEEMIANLHTVVSDLTTCDTEEEIYREAVESASSLLEFDRVAICTAEEDCLQAKAMSEQMPLDDRPTLSIDEGIAGKTYRSGEPLLVENTQTTDMAEPQSDEICSAMSVPIGEYGVLQVIDEEPNAFDQKDLELAQLLGRHVESALDLLEQERELKQRNDRLEDFANILSHDLRNPLNVASTRLALLADESDSEHIAPINRAHDRMETLIENLLLFAREGNMEATPVEVELETICEDSWKTVETSNATLVTDTDRTVRADESKLKQLFENLIRNSVEHGGDDLTVTTGDLPDGFYVADDGPGIPEDERSDVFEMGYSTSHDGVGFGLSIVNQVAEAHGWDIRLADGNEGGARFEITGVEFVDQ